ncbi:MAG: hypothetical protein PHT77_11310 [Bacteroidales bacterium]|nr:hypothetical protein [Bacteroidales bacterium]
MKKVCLILLLFLGFFQICVGQLDISFMAGINSTRFRTHPEKYIILDDWGYQAGVHVRYGKKSYFETGVQWLQSRSDFRSTLNGIFTEDEVEISQVRIPAYLGQKVIRLGVINFRLYTGPVLRIVTHVNNNLHALNTDSFSGAVWSWDFGAGLDVLLFSLDVNHESGLTAVFPSVRGSQSDILNITLGITF